MRFFKFRSPRAVLEAFGWLVLAGFLAYRLAPQAAAAFGIGTSTTSQAPSFQVRTLEGETLTTSSLRGKVVLVNFWATWCPPCRFEMPGFQRVYEARRSEGFVVLGLSTDQSGAATVAEFLYERAVTYPVAMATEELIRDFGGARALPTSYLLDRSGRIRYRVEGIFAEPALRAAVSRLLAESHPTPGAGGAP